ncbi:MAG TPA: hypothetical protein PK156_46555, partial [Polyangium sp.]|nr:hypothetical protein [Polyangium sp.]
MNRFLVQVVIVFGISSCGAQADKQPAPPPDGSAPFIVTPHRIAEKPLPVNFPVNKIPEGGVAVLAGDCSGTLFKMDGMTVDQKALVLTDGHCVGVGSFMGQFPADGEVLQDLAVNSQIVARKNK